MVIQETLDGRDLKLREVCAAGEPLNPEVIERVLQQALATSPARRKMIADVVGELLCAEANPESILAAVRPLCDAAKAQGEPGYVRMMERDIGRIIDLVAPDDGSGAANVKVVRKVLQQLQQNTAAALGQ